MKDPTPGEKQKHLSMLSFRSLKWVGDISSCFFSRSLTIQSLRIENIVVLGLVKSPGVFTYIKDHLGTVTELADNNGNIKQRYSYTSYGVLRSISSGDGSLDITANPEVKPYFTFTGREWDSEVGLYYYRARYYDANTGRFLQKDPDPGKLSSPNTFLSKYIYAAGNPAMFSDPSGRIAVVYIIGMVIGVIAGITAASLNYDAAKKAGLSNSQASWSAFWSFIFAGATGFLSVVSPGGSWLWAGAASGLTNMTNQLLSNGNNLNEVNWDRVGISFGMALLTDVFLGKVFKLMGVSGAIDRSILSSNFGNLAGYCNDFGFGPDATYSCGLQSLNPAPDTPDRSQPDRRE